MLMLFCVGNRTKNIFKFSDNGKEKVIPKLKRMDSIYEDGDISGKCIVE